MSCQVLSVYGFVFLARPREREQHPSINYPLETPLRSVPTDHRNRRAMEADHDTATAFLITVYRGAGKYDCIVYSLGS